VTAHDLVLVEVTDRVATVVLNRPEVRNALNGELIDALTARLAECEASADVDVMILTGADPAFCAGLDLAYLATRVELESGVDSDNFPPVPVPPHTKPLIGAVNGPAVTGGLELALACDFLVASERARFADTHARVGIVPGWRLTVALPEAVGSRRAKEMSATGNFVDADTALAWGLVNHVVPHAELLASCQRLGTDIASNDAAAAREILSTYNEEAELVDGPRSTIELDRFRRWRAEGKSDGAEIERRRAAIVDRGRGQTR
jgi:enoyl-CoA hydratase/carnithine racemase